MTQRERDGKIAFMTCVELVLMRRGNTKYHAIIAKLQSHYDSVIYDCLDHPAHLRDVLKDIYKDDYDTILNEISAETENLVDIDRFKNEFFKIMRS